MKLEKYEEMIQDYQSRVSIKGLVSNETVVLCRWGIETRKCDIKRVDERQIFTVKRLRSVRAANN